MKYLYSGPVSGVTLNDGTELMLLPGKAVELEQEHPYTKTLRALGHLTPMADAKATSQPVSKKSTKEVTDGR